MTESNGLKADYTLDEVAAALRMSPRWVRNRIKDGSIECTRRGHKIVFTHAQVETARAVSDAKPVVTQSVTTGRKRAS